MLCEWGAVASPPFKTTHLNHWLSHLMNKLVGAALGGWVSGNQSVSWVKPQFLKRGTQCRATPHSRIHTCGKHFHLTIWLTYDLFACGPWHYPFGSHFPVVCSTQRENQQNEKSRASNSKMLRLGLGLRLGPHICLGLSVNQRKRRKNELAMFK